MAARTWRGIVRAVGNFSKFCGYLTGGLIVVSSALITYEVIWRYYLSRPHTWSLEANVFLLIAATFLASAFTQREHGHVGTEVLDLVLPKHWVPWRVVLGDALSCAVCIFIGVSVTRYAIQAWDGDWATDSTWAPPLWIPYALIAAGLWLTALQCGVQIVDQIAGLLGRRRGVDHD
ncbi:MAG: TRAP transporter small permease [Candidimonas sp.]|nr:MAG: TRAP transporter small permease [Candidimonas sp.]